MESSGKGFILSLSFFWGGLVFAAFFFLIKYISSPFSSNVFGLV